MNSTTVVQLIFVVAYVSIACGAPVDDQIKKNLIKFGYLKQLRGRSIGGGDMTGAVKKLQKEAGLNITGILDEATTKMALAPRCGVITAPTQRGRSWNEVTIWKHREITWKIVFNGLEPKSLSRNEIHDFIQQALWEWQKIDGFPLRFIETPDAEKTDLTISFAKEDHGDRYSFDGRGAVLAHAFFPENGVLHFDADEIWTKDLDNSEGTNFFAVAIHELGHSIGLYHSENREAIMYPWYHGTPKIFEDDIRRLQTIYHNYEQKTTTTTPVPTTTTNPYMIKRLNWPASYCPKYISATVKARNQKMYIFANHNKVWILQKNGELEMNTLNNLFPGLDMNSGSITSASHDDMFDYVYLFQGMKAYKYEWKDEDQKFRLLRRWTFRDRIFFLKRRFFALHSLFILDDRGRKAYIVEPSTFKIRNDGGAEYFLDNGPSFNDNTHVFNMFDDVIFQDSGRFRVSRDLNIFDGTRKNVPIYNSISELLQRYAPSVKCQ